MIEAQLARLLITIALCAGIALFNPPKYVYGVFGVMILVQLWWMV